MCHLILLMPVFSLIVFWIWPFAVASSIYAAVAILSIWMYILIMRAMRRPVLGGAEELLHSFGEVLEAQGDELRVRVHSELWNAESNDTLRRGDRVKVVGILGLILKVRRYDDADDEARGRESFERPPLS